MLKQVFDYQNRMMDAKPKDYNGDQVKWEMNVLNWALKIIENDYIDLEAIKLLTLALEKSK